MRWAVKSRGPDFPPSIRAIGDDWPVDDDEIVTSTDPAGMVVAEDGITLRPASDAERLSAAKVARAQEITTSRAVALAALTVDVGGVTYDADEISTQRMTGALSMWERAVAAQDPRAPSQIAWLDASNRTRTLTITDLAQVASAAWLAQQVVWATSNAAKEAIATAASVDEVDAVHYPGARGRD